MTGFMAFHIYARLRAIGQYSINTKASSKFAVAGMDKRLVCKSDTGSDIGYYESRQLGENNL